MRVHPVFSLKEKGHPLKPSDRRVTSLHGHTHLLTQGQFCAACGDVLEPMYLIPVTLGTRVGEMDCPSLMTISLSTYRVSDFRALFYALVCDRVSPSPLSRGISSCCNYTRSDSGKRRSNVLQDTGAFTLSPSVLGELFAN